MQVRALDNPAPSKTGRAAPMLVVEHAGQRRQVPLVGKVWVGREPGNAVMINHPIVSRRHVSVELRDQGVAVVTDNGSRNGTLIAGEKLSGPRELHDGDIFQVGPATIIFHTHEPEIDIEAPSVDAADIAGIMFECDCGARLWSPRGTAGSSVICPRCRKGVKCPGTMPPPPTRHRVCGVCQWKIEPHEPDVTCPACGVSYHGECWRENKGCAAYGCSQVNVLAEREPEATPVDAGPMIDPALTELADLEQPRAVEVPLVAGAALASLVGVIGFGAPAAIVMCVAFGFLLVRRGRQRMLLALAVLIGFLGTIGGLFASLYWWLGLTPERLIGQ